MFPQRAKILDLFWWEKVCKQTLIKVIYKSETAFHDSWSTTCEISPLLQCQEGLQVKMLSEILDFLQYLSAVFCVCSVRSALTLISGVYHDHIQQPDTDAFCASFCSAYKTLISSELISPAHSADRKQMSLISCVCPRQRAGTMHAHAHNNTTQDHPSAENISGHENSSDRR